MKTFGEAVREIREAAGLSLREIAKGLGYSASFVSDIERGKRLPPGEVKKIEVWADLIGVKEVRGIVKLAVADRREASRRCPDCPLKEGK